MNNKQRAILAGRKPKHRDGKPTLDDTAKAIHGVSPIMVCAKWLMMLDVIQKAQLRMFYLVERIKQNHPNCVCTLEDVQPSESPTITLPKRETPDKWPMLEADPAVKDSWYVSLESQEPTGLSK